MRLIPRIEPGVSREEQEMILAAGQDRRSLATQLLDFHPEPRRDANPSLVVQRVIEAASECHVLAVLPLPTRTTLYH